MRQSPMEGEISFLRSREWGGGRIGPTHDDPWSNHLRRTAQPRFEICSEGKCAGFKSRSLLRRSREARSEPEGPAALRRVSQSP
jgi:hypothetical protein